MSENSRPLEERLAEYRDAMIQTRRGLLLLADAIEKRDHDATIVRSGTEYYKHVIDDLTKILDGEELKPFAIEVEL